MTAGTGSSGTGSSGSTAGIGSPGMTAGTGSSGIGSSGSTAGIGITRYDSGHWVIRRDSGIIRLDQFGSPRIVWLDSGHRVTRHNRGTGSKVH
ncbi:unnamed protein product [Staurois parvus]|uniref:Uncharacterized protein n=1 Tax=Staurois parvus TaxID=386267 RepID=A0ABN9E897_9NEOB|nr:unnamed protein product [Staurois parvus]